MIGKDIKQNVTAAADRVVEAARDTQTSVMVIGVIAAVALIIGAVALVRTIGRAA